jgi:aspartyl-tRNA(Asn)/glutamyl-tRNA(Gln) amidotransferase subunit B
MGEPSVLSQALQEFECVIGLEVHAQVKTKSKIFCSAATEFTPLEPNKNVHSYCIGLPGVLPVFNRRVIEMAIRAGLALECEVKKTSIWSRKHYFYPDLPKGYQLTQFDQPICEHGQLHISPSDGERKRIGITRIHMEEDAGKNTHVDGAPFTLLDYNRAGVPLLEIVSEPDLRSAQEATAYLRALRSILMTIDVCDGNMEEGSFRCDANVSIRPHGQETLGTRCEIKNINSFRFVQQAINFEVIRQARALKAGKEIVQETRLFDSTKKETRSMRSKEDAHDYRYFPDPDLPPLVIPKAWIDSARETLPELPQAKIARYCEMGISKAHAQTLAEEPSFARFFEQLIEHETGRAISIANFVLGDVLRELKESPTALEEARFAPADLAKLIAAKDDDKISSSQQKKIFQKLWSGKGTFEELLKEEGEQVSDVSVLGAIIDEVFQSNPGQVAQLKAGKDKLMSYMIGQVMRLSKGKAKPPLVQKLIQDKIRED